MSVFDSQVPGSQEWMEFRTAFAAARLQSWLIAGLEVHAPEFFANVEHAFRQAAIDAEDRTSLDPSFDWSEIDLPGGVTLVADHEDVLEIRDQLLPHAHTAETFPYRARCLAVVAMVSALEVYAKSAGAFSGGWLPESIDTWLSIRSGLTEPEYLRLRECDALRNLVVHSRGVVDKKFLQRYSWSQMQIGERYPLNDRQLWEHGNSVWAVAKRLRAAV